MSGAKGRWRWHILLLSVILFQNSIGHGRIIRRISFERPAFQYALGDFDGDGRCDLATLNDRSQLDIRWQRKGGTLELSSDVLPGSRLFSIAAYDVNRDGRDDLIATRFSLMIYFYTWQAGHMTCLKKHAYGDQAYAYLKLMPDEQRDILYIHTNLLTRIWNLKNQSFSTFWLSNPPKRGKNMGQPCMADLNLDRDNDAIINSEDGIRVYATPWMKGSRGRHRDLKETNVGRFHELPKLKMTNFIVADVDGDTMPELVFSDHRGSGGVSMVVQDRFDGFTKESKPQRLHGGPGGLLIYEDLNQNAVSDFVVVTAQDVRFFDKLSDAMPVRMETHGLKQIHSINVRDFDGDGLKDIAILAATGKELVILSPDVLNGKK